MGKLNRFSRRRWVGVSIFAWVCIALVLADYLNSWSIRTTVYYSGWTLLTLVIGLTAFNWRKRLSVIPIGSSAFWLQIHIYVGLLTLPLFAVHVRWRWPNGVFELFLASSFLIVFFSGLFGLIVSRVFAKRMTTRGPEELFERLPRRRNLVMADSERLVLDCLERTKSTALPEFFAKRVHPFLIKPRNFFRHLMLSTRPRRQILLDLHAQTRYLSTDEKEAMAQLSENIEYKDDLDFQYAHMAVLKYWLFVHVPIAYGLIVFSVTHVLLVHLFSGAIR